MKLTSIFLIILLIAPSLLYAQNYYVVSSTKKEAIAKDNSEIKTKKSYTIVTPRDFCVDNLRPENNGQDTCAIKNKKPIKKVKSTKKVKEVKIKEEEKTLFHFFKKKRKIDFKKMQNRVIHPFAGNPENLKVKRFSPTYKQNN